MGGTTPMPGLSEAPSGSLRFGGAPELRSPSTFGSGLIARMDRHLDFRPVLETAVDEFGFAAPSEALAAFEGFLQWFSMVPACDHLERFVVLRGPVDRLWHATILNTALYRELCARFVGRFIDHHANPGRPRVRWVLETVALIEAHFGDALHPEFEEWRGRAQASQGEWLEPLKAGA